MDTGFGFEILTLTCQESDKYRISFIYKNWYKQNTYVYLVYKIDHLYLLAEVTHVVYAVLISA